ncbi:hypothetical protein VNO77_11736 [Canavalia gladiata]|uniref:Cytoplasmic tRNA 2-thiolation protein 1 n=1 Tax=Canavalia gladiata TaxID=3824 RepID=A0AAN9MC91_CANGL
MEGEEGERRRGVRLCCLCNQKRASLKRPKTLQHICRDCFYDVFEDEIHQVILQNHLFRPGERIAIGASGGKDSTVLAYVLSKLNRIHNYGLHLFLLSVDEGITGYRDDSLETVHRNQIQYGLPLHVVSYKDLYGWTMDDIVKLIGLKNNCTFCGVFRRQALDRGASLLKVDKIVTGHNADDIAETVLLNLLRGDIARLSRCTSITTGEDGPIPRCKPFKYTYEKEIVIYPSEFVYQMNLNHFVFFLHLFYGWIRSLTVSLRMLISRGSTTSPPNAFILQMHIVVLLASSSRIWKESGLALLCVKCRPRAILDIIKSGENFRISTTTKMPEQGTCERCGYISSQKWCKACVLLDGLNRGLPKLGIGRSRGSIGFKNGNESDGAKSIESKQSGTLDF